MKSITKLSTIMIGAGLLLSACTINKPAVQAYKVYNNVGKTIKKEPHFHSHVQRSLFYDDSLYYLNNLHLISLNTKQYPKTTVVYDDNGAIMITSKKVTHVSFENSEYAEFSSSVKDSYYTLTLDNVRAYYHDATTCLVPRLNSLRNWAITEPTFYHSADTTARGKHCLALYADQSTSPYYNLVYLVDDSTNMLSRVEKSTKPGYDNVWQLTALDITYSHEDPSEMVKSIFDRNNPAYANYSFHDDANPPYFQMSISASSPLIDTDTLPQALLNYPLVSLNGDTTSIANTDGWILLDFWYNSCRGCLQKMAQLQRECDSAGYNILERNGITLMAINPLTNNNEITRSRVERFGLEPYTYTAKRMPEVMTVATYPWYMLISPDKRVYLSTNHINKFTDIVELKNTAQ